MWRDVHVGCTRICMVVSVQFYSHTAPESQANTVILRVVNVIKSGGPKVLFWHVTWIRQKLNQTQGTRKHLYVLANRKYQMPCIACWERDKVRRTESHLLSWWAEGLEVFFIHIICIRQKPNKTQETRKPLYVLKKWNLCRRETGSIRRLVLRVEIVIKSGGPKVLFVEMSRRTGSLFYTCHLYSPETKYNLRNNKALVRFEKMKPLSSGNWEHQTLHKSATFPTMHEHMVFLKNDNDYVRCTWKHRESCLLVPWVHISVDGRDQTLFMLPHRHHIHLHTSSNSAVVVE